MSLYCTVATTAGMWRVANTVTMKKKRWGHREAIQQDYTTTRLGCLIGIVRSVYQ